MAPTFSASIPAYSGVAILPNSTDDWSATSPFSSYNLAGGKTGFVLGTITASSLSSYVKVPGRLIEVGKIDRSVDIFETSADELFGIGGVAKVNDVEFSLENVSSNITFVDLIGRTVKIIIGTGASMQDIGHTTVAVLFTGKIWTVTPARDVYTFICRGNFSILGEKEVGQVNEGESEIYKSKITPLHYGDLSDEYAFMPLVLSNQIDKDPQLIIDSKILFDISDFFCWDDASKLAYRAVQELSHVDLVTNKNTINFSRKYTDVILVDELNAVFKHMNIYDPPTVAFLIDSAPTLTVGDTYIHVIGLGLNPAYIYKEKIDDYYIFIGQQTYADDESVPGVLSKVTGAVGSPANMDYSFRSSFLDPFLNLEQTTEERIDIINNGGSGVPDHRVYSQVKTQPLFIKMDSEVIQIIERKEHVEIIAGGALSTYIVYDYTRCSLVRECKGTVGEVHAASYVINKLEPELTAHRWLVRHVFPVRALSNWRTFTDGDQCYVEVVDGDLAKAIEGFTYPAVDASNFFKILLSCTGTPNNDALHLVMDLHFDPVSVNGEIATMYLLGYFQVYADDSVILMSRGGKMGNGANIGYNLFKDSVSKYGDLVFRNTQYPYIKYSSDYYNRLVLDGSDTKIWSNNPIENNNSVRGYSLRGAWIYNSLTSEHMYFLNDAASAEMQDTSGILTDDIRGTFDALNLEKIVDLNEANYRLVLTNRVDTSALFKLANLGFLIDFYVDPLAIPFWVRGKGRVYDSSTTYFNGTADTLIENPVSVIEDICRQELGLTNDELDSTSFTAAYNSRLNWKAAFSLFGDPIIFRDLVQKICKQFGMILTETPDGKLAPRVLDIPETTSGLTAISDSHTLRDSNNVIRYEESYTTLDLLITAFILKYKMRYTDELFMETINSADVSWASELASAAQVLDTTRLATFLFSMIRDLTTVERAGSLAIQYLYQPIRIIKWYTDLTYYAKTLGDWVTCSSSIIKNVSGKIYLIVDSSIQVPHRFTKTEITLTGLEFDVGSDDNIQEVYDAVDEGWQEVHSGVTGDNEIQEVD
jgi:hypothetical protein